MGEWKKVRLGDCIKEINERTTENNQYQVLSVTKDGIFSQEEYFKKQIASENNIGYKILRRNNLVFSTMNLWMGSLDVLINYDIGIVSPAYKIFEFNENLMLPEFGNYFMRSYYMLEQYKNCSEQGASVVRRNLDLKALLDIIIQVPSIEEQKNIIKILGNVDKIIFSYEKLLNQKDQLKKCQFEKMICNEKNINKLGDVTIKITDGSHNPPKHFGEQTEYKMLSAQNIGEDGLNYDNIRYLSNEDYLKENRRTDIQKNDILYSIVGTIGKTYIVRDEKNVVFQRSVAILKLKDDMNPYYIKYLLNSHYIKKQIEKISKGNAQKGIYLDDLKKLNVKIPSIEEQNKLAKILNQFDNQNIGLKKAIENYKNLKKGLMQKLLTGKIRVKI